VADVHAPDAPDAPEISVVIPVRNEEHHLPPCLDALAAQVDAPRFEVIVVDNGSTDRTVEVASGHGVVSRVMTEAARGPYAARNTGIAAARGKVVALTDADAVAWPRWLAEASAALAGADLVGGTVRQRPSGTAPTLWERYDSATYLDQDENVHQLGFAATANLVVRRSVFDTIGVFRPELVASGDTEFGLRATAAGLRLRYCAEAGVDHAPRTTMRATWELHRKLGSGFAELARAGLRPKYWADPALRTTPQHMAHMVDLAARQGPPVRRRYLVPVHLVVMTARWVGYLSGRG